MKIKLMCFFIIFVAGTSAFASAIIDHRIKPSTSAIQSSNIELNRANYSEYFNSDTLMPAVKEIQNKIDKTPGDYSLYVSLVDLYIKMKRYDSAYEELTFLYNLSQQDKLNSQVLQQIDSLYKSYQKILKTNRNNYSLYLDMAVMAMILQDKNQADILIDKASSKIYDVKLFKNAVEKVIDYTQNYKLGSVLAARLKQKAPNDVEILKMQAKYLILQGNTTAAIEECRHIIAADPEDDETKYFLFKMLINQNKNEKEIINTIYNNPENDKIQYAYSDISNILVKNNDIDNAKVFISSLLKAYPDNAEGYILLSDIYRKEGKLKESYELLEKGRDKVNSSEAVSKYNVLLAKLSDEPVNEANSLIANGLYNEALEVLASANQESLYVILTQARANYMLSEKQKSLELLNKAMTLFPNNSDVFCAFGYIYLKEKDIESARKYVNESLKINPDNKTALDLLDMVNKAEADKNINQIVVLFETQNYTEAMRLIDETIKVNPKDANLYYYKALTYIAQNNYAASTASLYKCIELDKNNALAYFYLGIAFDNLSEPKNALMYYQKFIELLPKDEFGESEKLEYANSRITKLKAKNN